MTTQTPCPTHHPPATSDHPAAKRGDRPKPRARGRFVAEGQFLALPLAMVDECEPIDDDSAYVRRIVASPCGRWAHGLTEGKQRHLFTGLFKAAAGGVVDLGPLDSAGEVASMAHWPGEGYRRDGALLGLNHGDRFELMRQTIPIVDDGIQEPGYDRRRRYTVAEVAGQRLIDARPAEGDPLRLVCLTQAGVVTVSLDEETRDVIDISATDLATAPADGARFAAAGGRWHWLTRSAGMASVEPTTGQVEPRPLTEALPDEPIVAWAGVEGLGLVAVLRGGSVWRIDPETGAAHEAARSPLGFVQTAAVLPDGRIYAMCGEDVAQFYRLEPATGEVEPLGAVASAIAGKRYGFNFADASVTDEGVVFFAEHDRGGHLWVYYPPMR